MESLGQIEVEDFPAHPFANTTRKKQHFVLANEWSVSTETEQKWKLLEKFGGQEKPVSRCMNGSSFLSARSGTTQ